MLDATFAALSDPVRRAMLARLALGEATVNELAAPFPISQPAISRHLQVLEKAGLISRSRDAQRRPCRIEGKALAEVHAWLDGYRKVYGPKISSGSMPCSPRSGRTRGMTTGGSRTDDGQF